MEFSRRRLPPDSAIVGRKRLRARSAAHCRPVRHHRAVRSIMARSAESEAGGPAVAPQHDGHLLPPWLHEQLVSAGRRLPPAADWGQRIGARAVVPGVRRPCRPEGGANGARTGCAITGRAHGNAAEFSQCTRGQPRDSVISLNSDRRQKARSVAQSAIHPSASKCRLNSAVRSPIAACQSPCVTVTPASRRSQSLDGLLQPTQGLPINVGSESVAVLASGTYVINFPRAKDARRPQDVACYGWSIRPEASKLVAGRE
jgi:hypothetical protein